MYFDISSEESGGSLFRVTDDSGAVSFLYEHSTFDPDTQDVQVFRTQYADFLSFWKDIRKDKEWYYLHPLFVHPEQRDFIRSELRNANWNIHPDHKWQESHQRQWKKVLEDPGTYYTK